MDSTTLLDHVTENGTEMISSLKFTTIDTVGGIFCNVCRRTFPNKKSYDAHYAGHFPDIKSSEIEYTCVVCHRLFVGYSSLRGHCYINHVQKDKFKCNICEKAFDKKASLNNHIKALHNFKCTEPNCKEKFNSKKDLHIHQFVHKTKANKPPYLCKTCNELIDALDVCEQHIDQHCMFTYTCPICNETITKNNASKHLTIHFGDANNEDTENVEDNELCEESSINLIGGVNCCYCEKVFKNRMEIDTHFAEDHHNADKAYSCLICNKHFDNYTLLSKHCYDHCNKDKFECDECEKCFSRLADLVCHVERAHAEGRGAALFACSQCDHACANQRKLRAHVKAAHDTYCHACPEPGCNVTFEKLKDLIIHQKRHTPAMDRWCRRCGLHFAAASAALRHLDLHRTKRYDCPVCSRPYTEKYLVTNHIAQHFESVFHMCKVCGKIFNAKNRLVEHAKTHSSAKNFECKYCGRGFMKSNHLQQHLHIHTGTKPYKCVACPKTFGCQPNWRKHMLKIHNIDSKTVKAPSLKDPVENNENTAINGIEDEPTTETNGSDVTMSSLKSYVDNDDSTMDSDHIDPIVKEKEAQILEADVLSTSPCSDSTGDYKIGVASDIESVFAAEDQSTLVSASSLPIAQPVVIPREYGPDFDNGPGDLIDLDDHLLPHIDPHLTTKQESLNKMYVDNITYQHFDDNIAIDTNEKWEPPVISRIYSNYYADIDDVMSIVNTDIF